MFFSNHRYKNLEILEKKYQQLLIIQRVGNDIVQNLNFEEIAQNLVDSVVKNLNYMGGILFLVEENQNTIRSYNFSETRIINKAVKPVKPFFRKLTTKLNEPENFVGKCIKENHIIEGDDVSDFISPPVNKNLARIMQKTAHVKSIVIAPINVKKKTIGAMMFVTPNKTITKDEKEMLQIFANQAGIAIENSKLYQEIKTINRSLKQKTRQLAEANEHLKEMDKAKSEFVSIASHQLRSPLTSIKGYLSMMMEGTYGKIAKKQEEPLRIVYESSDNLLKMVEELLNISRIEKGDLRASPENQDITPIIKEVLDELKESAKKKGLKIKSQIKKTLPEVFVDKYLVRQIVLNLIDNAIKYTENGEIQITSKNDQKNVIVEIKDTGMGISESDMKKLFIKFSRGEEVQKLVPSGSGLGLFTAKKMAEEHGGKIWASSDGVGKGSIFGFSIPISKQKITK